MAENVTVKMQVDTDLEPETSTANEDNFQKILDMVANSCEKVEDRTLPEIPKPQVPQLQMVTRAANGIQSPTEKSLHYLVESALMNGSQDSEDGTLSDEETPKVKELKKEQGLVEEELGVLVKRVERDDYVEKRIKELVERKRWLEMRVNKLIKDRRNQAEYRKRKRARAPKIRPRGRPRLEEKYPKLLAALMDCVDNNETSSVPKIREELARLHDIDIKKSTLYTRISTTPNKTKELNEHFVTPLNSQTRHGHASGSSSTSSRRGQQTVKEYLINRNVDEQVSAEDMMDLFKGLSQLAAFQVPDEQIQYCFDILRPFFTKNDPASLPLLGQLAENAQKVFNSNHLNNIRSRQVYEPSESNQVIIVSDDQNQWAAHDGTM